MAGGTEEHAATKSVRANAANDLHIVFDVLLDHTREAVVLHRHGYVVYAIAPWLNAGCRSFRRAAQSAAHLADTSSSPGVTEPGCPARRAPMTLARLDGESVEVDAATFVLN